MVHIEIKHYEDDFMAETENCRRAVRAIVCKDDKVLMIESERVGDYKFPGGGIENGETDKQALIREVKEESGYSVIEIGEIVFRVSETSKDKEMKNAIFKMLSDYYVCEVSEEVDVQKLDDYEKDLGFRPKWISIHEALNRNSEVLKSVNSTKWIKREMIILNEIINRKIPLTIAST